jgi:hypothetical protein
MILLPIILPKFFPAVRRGNDSAPNDFANPLPKPVPRAELTDLRVGLFTRQGIPADGKAVPRMWEHLKWGVQTALIPTRLHSKKSSERWLFVYFHGQQGFYHPLR